MCSVHPWAVLSSGPASAAHLKGLFWLRGDVPAPSAPESLPVISGMEESSTGDMMFS